MNEWIAGQLIEGMARPKKESVSSRRRVVHANGVSKKKSKNNGWRLKGV
jgi:hypothetical protein